MGWTYLLLREPEKSISYLQTALDICESTHSKLHKPFLLGAVAYANALTGRLNNGLALFKQALGIAEQERVNAYITQVHLWLAETYLLTGDREQASKRAALVRHLASETGRIGYLAKAEALNAEVAFIMNKGAASTRQALELAERNARKLCLVSTANRCARVLNGENLEFWKKENKSHFLL